MAVTLLAVFVAYHVNWIRQRRSGFEGTRLVTLKSYDLRDFTLSIAGTSLPHRQAPGLLRFFGERGYSRIVVRFGTVNDNRFTSPYHTSRDVTPVEMLEVDRIKRLFPEADVDGQATEVYGAQVP
ncbi:MAG TPA: hypothetical protein VGJ26_09415 [Pirellulales bacterium]